MIHPLFITAYCIWSVISSFSNLHRWSSPVGIFYHPHTHTHTHTYTHHVPLNRDQGDWDWRLRLYDNPNAIGCIWKETYTYMKWDLHICGKRPMRSEIEIVWHCKCNRLYMIISYTIRTPDIWSYHMHYNISHIIPVFFVWSSHMYYNISHILFVYCIFTMVWHDEEAPFIHRSFSQTRQILYVSSTLVLT